ncbi:MAG: YfiR family protein [Bdellovibrionia bacterium]
MTNMRMRLSTIILPVLAFAAGTSVCVALADPVKEYKVQTAFIYQFTNYVEWPQDKSAISAQEPFIIAVIGSSPIVQELEALAKIKTVKGRKIEVNKIENVSLLGRSNIIVIASTDESLLRQAVQKTTGSGALIVSYSEGFAQKGAMINFFQEEGRLRFEINRTALESQKLQVSSQLLKLAKLIK